MTTTRQAKVIQVIETISVRGDGKETIMREVRQYWDFDGNLLSENDPCAAQDSVDEIRKMAAASK